MNITVLKVEPGREPEVISIENELSAFQLAVDGYIETVTLPDGCVIICNEEGKLNDSKLNRYFVIGNIWVNTIFGTFLIARTDEDEFSSLRAKDIAYWTKEFKLGRNVAGVRNG